MAILLTNDDGIEAPGLAALAEALAGLDKLSIAAPASNQSAVGMGLTIHRNLTTHRRPAGPDGIARHSLDGTPADCVLYGLRHMFRKPPRLVVSGINMGANLGQNVLCSGTVAAAFAAVIAGVPAVATSLGWSPEPDWTGAKHYTRVVVEKALELLKSGRKRPFLLNLNVPALPAPEIRGLAVARHGVGGFKDELGMNDDGETYSHVGNWVETPPPPEGDCDNAAFLAGYAVVTPLTIDMTDCNLLDHLQNTWK